MGASYIWGLPVGRSSSEFKKHLSHCSFLLLGLAAVLPGSHPRRVERGISESTMATRLPLSLRAAGKPPLSYALLHVYGWGRCASMVTRATRFARQATRSAPGRCSISKIHLWYLRCAMILRNGHRSGARCSCETVTEVRKRVSKLVELFASMKERRQ